MVDRILGYFFWLGILGVLGFGGSLLWGFSAGVSMAEMPWAVIGLIGSMVIGALYDLAEVAERISDYFSE